MKAFTIGRYKSKDGGRIVDMPQPAVGDNDVLVQVHAAGKTKPQPGVTTR